VAIRFVHVYDAEHEARRLAEVQRIFRTYFGEATGAYSDTIPDLLRRQGQLGHRTIIITAEDPRGRVLAFAMAFHYTDVNVTLLDYIVVDPAVRQRGIGGALYEALREYLVRLGTRGLYLEVRPDDPTLEPDPAVRRENRARIRFYERYGARVVLGTAYEARRPGRAEGEPYLVFDGLGGDRVPSAEEVRDVVRALLYRKYAYAHDDPYARAVVASVGARPIELQPPRSRAAAPRVVPAAHGVFAPCKVLVSPQHRLHHVRERGYVERPVRVDRILQAITALPGVEVVPVAEHGELPVLAVHDPDYVRYLERVCSKLAPDDAVYPYVFPLRKRERQPLDEEIRAGYYCMDTFTPLTQNAYVAARAAADCALTGADCLMRGERLAYAICRPPGHHAERRVYGGFCYLSNAAIAAEALSALGKVAVLDIDFHHGNGTQDVFYDRADVLTISIHGDPSYAYPYFAGFADERGEGAGEGFNHNFPLPENTTDDEYVRVLEQALSLVEQFAPAHLVVSVGLDIAKGDPTGAWVITTEGFERIGGAIAGLGLPTLAVQEGGYDTRVLGRNARTFLAGLQRGIYERRAARRPASSASAPSSA
jgi:acetoin utilization deacetylase AcuC-like enzyme/ribosomal protein S18 acetylase RimI-like enzyme